MNAELSALAGALEELGARLTGIAEGEVTRREDVAHELFEIERVLKAAQRRLRRLVDSR